MSRPSQSRSAVTKANSKQVIVYFPSDVVPLIDQAAREDDTDRSKFIRAAVRKALRARAV